MNDTKSVEFIFRNIEEFVKISLQQVTFAKSELIFWEAQRTLSPVSSIEIEGKQHYGEAWNKTCEEFEQF